MKPIAETTNGNVQGSYKEGALVFLGIRYGQSTAGENRFLPPQPAEKWAGTIEAVAPGPSAPQLEKPENTDPFFSWYSAIRPISEDCLFLNVFTPSLHGKRPVMFWIHGGGWREYSGTAPGFDGTRLATAQDVTVITVNHRLNAFGFLTLDSNDDRFAESGNTGILDIIAALEWVRDNAEAFGGDPGNVTIFGESGGASKVAALMAVETAKGLFHRAIVQSSAGVRLASLDESAKVSQSLAKALGRERLEPLDMQSLPFEAILDAMRKAPNSYRGVIDGRTFLSDPFGNAAPAMAADVPLMVGCTNTEFTYYMRNDPRNFHLGLSHVRQRLGRFLNVDETVIAHLLRAYEATSPRLSPSELMIAIATDQIFKRNTYEIAKLQAASAGAPVYAYLFEWETPIEGGRMRSPHTCEVPFVFGTFNTAHGCVGTGAELAGLSEQMMSVWATFARTGDPNVSGLPYWHPYDHESRRMMVLNVESRLAQDPGAAARAALDDLPYFSHRNSIVALTTDMAN